MPVFNDSPFYFSGGYNLYPNSFTGSNKNGYHGLHSSSNFNYSNALGNTNLYGGRPYKPDISKYGASGRPAKLYNSYLSNYVTYSDWKENLLLNKIREDTSYKWQNKNAIGTNQYYRQNRPVFIDTAKIDVSRPKQRKQIEITEDKNKVESEEKPNVGEEKFRGTISRGRTVVRIHTKALKENPYFQKKECEEVKSQVENLESDKKSIKKSIKIKENDLELADDDDDALDHSKIERRKSTLKKNQEENNETTIQREETLTNNKKSPFFKGSGTIVRKCKVRKKSKERRESTDSELIDSTGNSRKSSLCVPSQIDIEKKRLSMELYEEQAAILDSLIREELAKKDADDYFSDPKRGTVKIPAKQRFTKSVRNSNLRKSNLKEQCAESSTTDDDLDPVEKCKRTTKKKNRFIPLNDTDESSSGSRRNSLFQDLFIEATIAENSVEESVKTNQSDIKNHTQWKIEQKVVNKPKKSNLNFLGINKLPKISAVVNVEEKQKTPKFYIENVKIELSDGTSSSNKKESVKAVDSNENFTNKKSTIKEKSKNQNDISRLTKKKNENVKDTDMKNSKTQIESNVENESKKKNSKINKTNLLGKPFWKKGGGDKDVEKKNTVEKQPTETKNDNKTDSKIPKWKLQLVKKNNNVKDVQDEKKNVPLCEHKKEKDSDKSDSENKSDKDVVKQEKEIEINVMEKTKKNSQKSDVKNKTVTNKTTNKQTILLKTKPDEEKQMKKESKKREESKEIMEKGQESKEESKKIIINNEKCEKEKIFPESKNDTSIKISSQPTINENEIKKDENNNDNNDKGINETKEAEEEEEEESSSVTTTEANNTDLETEDEIESDSDESSSEINNQSCSNDSGFGSTQHKSNQGIYVYLTCVQPPPSLFF